MSHARTSCDVLGLVRVSAAEESGSHHPNTSPRWRLLIVRRLRGRHRNGFDRLRWLPIGEQDESRL